MLPKTRTVFVLRGLVRDKIDEDLKKILGKDANLDLLTRQDMVELVAAAMLPGNQKVFTDRAKGIYAARLKEWEKDEETRLLQEEKEQAQKERDQASALDPNDPLFDDENYTYYRKHGPKKFISKRRKEFANEYDLSNPADSSQIHTVIVAELRLMQLTEQVEMLIAENEVIGNDLYKDIETTRISLSKALSDLSILKRFRPEDETKNNLADLVKLYDKYYDIPQKDLLRHIRNEKVGKTLTEEQIEEISNLRKKIRNDEENQVPIPKHYLEAVKKNILTEPELLFIEHLRNDPVYAAKVLYDISLDWYQVMVLRSWWQFKPFYMYLGARGVAKTFLGGLYSLLVISLFTKEIVIIVAPSFRQSSQMWQEASNVVTGQKGNDSDVGLACLDGEPKRNPDQREINSKTGSRILALPLGTGEKIRSKRASRLMIDERQDVPQYALDVIVKPFANVSQNPMERIRQKQMGMEADPAFSIINSGTAGFEDTPYHKDFLHFMGEDGDKYQLDIITIDDPSPGYINEDIVEDVKRSLKDDTGLFGAEYYGKFISQQNIFYPPSLFLDACSERCPVRLMGHPGKEYYLGIDPISGGETTGDVMVVSVFEYDPAFDYANLVYLKGIHFEYAKDLANFIRELVVSFEHNNGTVAGIALEMRGGGFSIRERLMEEGVVKNPFTLKDARVPPLIPVDSPDDIIGRRLVHCVFGNSTLNMVHHFNFKEALNNHELYLPKEATTQDKQLDRQYFAEIQSIFDEFIILRQEAKSLVTKTTRGGDIVLQPPSDRYHDDYVFASIRGYSLVKERQLQGSKRKAKTKLIIHDGSLWATGGNAYGIR